MTEQEFLDATNLVKVQSARDMVRESVAMNSNEEAWRNDALVALRDWEEYLTTVTAQRTGTVHD